LVDTSKHAETIATTRLSEHIAADAIAGARLLGRQVPPRLGSMCPVDWTVSASRFSRGG
jgi:hypothetical protein